MELNRKWIRWLNGLFQLKRACSTGHVLLVVNVKFIERMMVSQNQLNKVKYKSQPLLTTAFLTDCLNHCEFL